MIRMHAATMKRSSFLITAYDSRERTYVVPVKIIGLLAAEPKRALSCSSGVRARRFTHPVGLRLESFAEACDQRATLVYWGLR